MKFGVTYRHIETQPNEAETYVWVEADTLEELEEEVKRTVFYDLDPYQPEVRIFDESGRILSKITV